MKIIYKNGQEDVFECQYNVDYERRIVELITGITRKRIVIPFEQIAKIIR